MTDSSAAGPPTPGTTSIGGGVALPPQPKIVFDMTDKALVKAMESIQPDEILAFVTLLETVTTDKIDISLFAIFEFQGFDPNSIIRKLLVINKHYRDTLGKAEETLEILKQDVMFMIAANIYMGNLQDKSLSRRSGLGRQKIGDLIAKYNMKRGTTRAGLPSDTLTFPRVANSFPVLTTRMAKLLPSKDFVGSAFNTVELPKFMRVSSFASLCDESIPERTRMFLLHAVCSYSCDQSMVVHEGRKREKRVKKDEDVMTPVDAFSLQWNFIEVASKSPVPKIQMKRGMMVEFQIQSLYDLLAPVVSKFRTLIGDPTSMVAKTDYEKDITDFVSTASP
jgi:hypothetical protein